MKIKESLDQIFNTALESVLSKEAEHKMSKDKKHCFEIEGFTVTITEVGSTTYTLSILNRVKDIPLSRLKEVKEIISSIETI